MPPSLAAAMVRVTRERAMLYTKAEEAKAEQGDMKDTDDTTEADTLEVNVYLRPRLTGFMVPSVLSLCVSIILSAVAWHSYPYILSSDGSADAVITILLLCSSLSSLYVARPDEHRYRSKMLAWPRFFVLVSGLLVAGVGVSVVFLGSCRHFVKSAAQVSTVGCATILVGLLVFMVPNMVRRLRISSQSGDTRDLFDGKSRRGLSWATGFWAEILAAFFIAGVVALASGNEPVGIFAWDGCVLLIMMMVWRVIPPAAPKPEMPSSR